MYLWENVNGQIYRWAKILVGKNTRGGKYQLGNVPVGKCTIGKMSMGKCRMGKCVWANVPNPNNRVSGEFSKKLHNTNA